MEVEGELREVKALASSTRIEILKKLSERNHTVSELSRALNLSKPTILHHMRILEDAGFIKRVEDGRKWVYYQLTERGWMILKLRRLKLILSVLLILLPLAILISFLNSLRFGAHIQRAPEASLIIFIITLLAYFTVRRRLAVLKES
ncbi:MAG: hypothetical protein PWR13_497 [Archaeoglobi archaeon]|nr:hypothetical protein [Archaeoglobi archaeon]